MDNNIKAPKINNIINVYSSKFLNVFEVGFKDKKNNDTIEKKIITFILIKITVKGIKCYLFA